MNGEGAAGAAAAAHLAAHSPLKRAKVDGNGREQGHAQAQAPHLGLPSPSLAQLHPPPPSFAPSHSSAPFQSATSAASAHAPLLSKKRFRSEGEGEVEALLIQLRVDNQQQQQQQAATAAQQWAGASAAGHAIAAASSPAHASSNSSMCADPTPSPLNSGAVFEARYPSPLPAQLAELHEEDEYAEEDVNGPRDTSRDVPTPARSVSMERMQSFARFQPSTSALMGAGARPIATAPPPPAAAAAAAMSGGWSLPHLVDPLVLTHLAQHLPVLPSTLPGLSSEVLVLMLLSKMELDSLPQGGAPLTQAQFLEGLRGIGCASDPQLQLLLQNMLVEFMQQPAPNGSSASSSSSDTFSSHHAAPAAVSPAFKSFFLHCFTILRRLCGPATKKALDLPTAHRFLGLLLGERYPQHMFPFLSFLDELVRRGRAEGGGGAAGGGATTPNATLFSAQLETHRYSYDKWACTLEWCLSIHPHTLAGYDEEGSWPVVFDDFVAWLCERAPAVREASAREAAAAAAAAAQQRALEERRRTELDAASTRRTASDVFISTVLSEQSAAVSASSASSSSSSGSVRGGAGLGVGFGRLDAVQPLDADLDSDALHALSSSLDPYEAQRNVTATAGFHTLAHVHPSMALLPLQSNVAADLSLNPYERIHRQLQQQQQQPPPAMWHSSAAAPSTAMQPESHNMCDQD